MNDPSRDRHAWRASLVNLLGRMRDREIWVVGDIMLDEYVVGTAERISPEAPVPVLKVDEVQSRLGGAANVARQITALGAHATLAGVLGEDPPGEQILSMCAGDGIDTRAVLRLADRRSTRKVRVLGRDHQMLRIDWEDATACPEAAAYEIMERLAGGRRPDVIVLSDYAKGVLTQQVIQGVLAYARSSGIRVIVDPKQRDFTRYRGASIITPNLSELRVAAVQAFDPGDINSIAQTARVLGSAAEIDAMVVTLGERGMVVVPMDGPYLAIPAEDRHLVSDTTGAGDTAIATLAVCLAADATLEEAAHIANAAASVAVSRVGAVAVDLHSIHEVLDHHGNRKIFLKGDLEARTNDWRKSGRRTVFTNGCFDLLHAGHLSLLHDAARCGDILIVAINSDASVRRLKGATRPIMPEHERAALLAALTCVDAVIVFDEDTPLEVLQAIRPDVLVKGQDYRLENVVGRELVEGYGGRVVLLPLVPEKSTTALIDRIVTNRQSG
jgi:D-beta-D-heptose 7-phosphate kinase/D-beta-D-heptose 1-phosphate adenosyltransferase